MMEEWRAVVGYEGLYEVSQDGSIRCLHGQWTGLILKPDMDSDGYLRIGMSREGRRNRHRVHRVVAAAFHPGKQNALHREVAHLDNDRANPRADNLKWVSHAENTSHKRLHGTHPAGENHPRAKLTEANVIAIRHASQPYGSLAERYGVSWRTISDIKRGLRWKHLLPIGGKA